MDHVKKISLLGFGGTTRIVCDIVSSSYKNIEIQAIYDDAEVKKGTVYKGLSIKDSIKNFLLNARTTDFYFNCIGNITAYKKRIEYSRKLTEKGLRPVTLISMSSVVSETAEIGKGSLICPLSVIHTNSKIGDENIIFSGSVVEHDSLIGNYCYLSPSVTICGKVVLKDYVYIGPNSVLTAGITIGENSIIGAGSVVLSDVPPDSVYVGNPAKFLKKNDLWRIT